MILSFHQEVASNFPLFESVLVLVTSLSWQNVAEVLLLQFPPSFVEPSVLGFSLSEPSSSLWEAQPHRLSGQHNHLGPGSWKLTCHMPDVGWRNFMRAPALSCFRTPDITRLSPVIPFPRCLDSGPAESIKQDYTTCLFSSLSLEWFVMQQQIIRSDLKSVVERGGGKL